MLKQDAQNLQPQLVQWRRALHQMPETGLHLPQTRAFLCGVLEEMGLSFRLHKDTSSLEVLLPGTRPGKTIALRADMDALPIQEQTKLPFASTNGAMHACGHDAHMAMLLGAISLLRGMAFPGCIKCLFQAGEEGYNGAQHMVEEGALEQPHVDAVVGLHVTNAVPELRPGTIGVRSGPLMAGSDAFRIVVTGKSGHISDTEHVRNPIFAAAHLACAIQRLGELHQSDPEPSVIALGTIHGGVRGNAVPDTVELQGSIRTLDPDGRATLLEQLNQLLQQCREETGCQYALSFPEGTGIVINAPALTARISGGLGQLLGEDFVPLTSKLMASDDISVFFQARKGCYLHLGCGLEDETELHPLHNSGFCLNEDVLWRGTAALVQSALSWLADPT